MARFKVGVQQHPQVATVDELRAAARAADGLGVDSIWVWDHFFPLYGNPEANHYEAYTLLAAMAAETSNAKLGALVTCNSYRNPDLLADMARTIDLISHGRFVLGIGSGWFERDYREYGYEFGTAGSRLSELGAALPRIKDRWSKLNPAPTRDIPILIGGGGEKKTLRYVAEHASIWHIIGDLPTVRHKNGVLDSWCAELGRDPAQIERSVKVTEPPEQVADDLLAAGFTQFTVSQSGPDYDLALLRQWLDWREKQSR